MTPLLFTNDIQSNFFERVFLNFEECSLFLHEFCDTFVYAHTFVWYVTLPKLQKFVLQFTFTQRPRAKSSPRRSNETWWNLLPVRVLVSVNSSSFSRVENEPFRRFELVVTRRRVFPLTLSRPNKALRLWIGCFENGGLYAITTRIIINIRVRFQTDTTLDLFFFGYSCYLP